MKVVKRAHYLKINIAEKGALPHQKCYRKDLMPQIENVTQIRIRAPEGGRPGGDLQSMMGKILLIL
jgi:hypothetical protein